MKKKNALILALIIFSAEVHAQSGNVGIGTSSPTNKLTVNGNASVGLTYTGVSAPVNGAIIEGNTGIGTNTPLSALHVQATSDDNPAPFAKGIIAQFDPFGGSNIAKSGSIVVNGRAFFGYDIEGGNNKYTYIRGNQATDIRLQVVDAAGNLSPNTFVMSGQDGQLGFVGLNTDAPQAQLDVRGNIKSLAGTEVQSGSIWHGTSNINGFETYTTASGDAWVGIQRNGAGAPLCVTKSVSASTGQLINFYINGAPIGSISHTATGVLYNATSDMRLKENIHPSQFGLETLKKIGIYDYNYKADQKKDLATGVLAQELYKIYPQAVTPGGADEKKEPWMVDYSKLVPMLIKSVQEMAEEIKQLKEILNKQN
ncbi:MULTISPECIES: tail fiber domain-containing protein [unclassified Chryseobacterium]|uniref:tail fiber domain-containing protein n=1 Tax=unclassified Chryseobacterium TaxID=2593645 RepID=UPI003010513B